jgi:hypothetical protein
MLVGTCDPSYFPLVLVSLTWTRIQTLEDLAKLEKLESGTMPDDVKEIYQRLWQDVCSLHLNWNTYRQLFGTSPERIQLLNRFGLLFFGQIQRVIFADITLRLCHLTDPASQGEHENQSILRLLNMIDNSSHGLCNRLGVNKKKQDLIKKCKKFRELRNRSVAHKDWKRRATPLPATSRQNVENCLAILRSIMNTLESHYGAVPTHYQGLGRVPGDAEYLVERLQDLARRIDAERGILGKTPPLG